MTTNGHDEGQRLFGSSIKRREDPRFLTGKGQYVDDVKLPGTTHAAFVRSPHAHAAIKAINTAAAREMPGVVGIFTGADMKQAGVNGLPVGWLLDGLQVPAHMPLAVDRARHVGDAVAVVIAETVYQARDAAERIEVDYEPLPAIADTERALAPDAPQVYDTIPRNRAFHWSLGNKDETEAAFAGAAKVVKQRLLNNRLIATAIEPRAALASYNPATDDLTLWVTSQNPHVHRLLMAAFVLGIPEHKMRVISPDVGGGFGSKIFVYQEEVVVSWATRLLKRPVKWTAERRESFLTDCHGRDHVTDAEMAFDATGKAIGVRVKTIANMGAYLSTFAPAIPTYLYGTLLSGQYKIPAIHVEVDGVFTNTTPVDAYRGAGRPEATFVVERMMDLGARAFGADPAEFRRRSFIGPDEFPYQTPVAVAYDSGNYAPALDRALTMVEYAKLREDQERLRKEGRYIGIGLSTYIEACGLAPSKVAGALGAQAGLWESALVRVHPTGKVTVFTGSHSHGQGHETTFAQVVADELGLPMADVEIVHGDTASVPFGMGSYGSRSAAVGGAAIHTSLQKIKEKGKKIAAHLLEAAPEDLEYANGKWSVKGSPDRSKAFGEVALMAYLAHNYPEGLEPGLEASSFFDPGNFVFPFGAHISVVEVEKTTGQVKLLRYIAVDDVGNVINPMILDGMVHGGLAQGISQALWENAVYDESGQLLTGSLMEYAVPKADMLIGYELDRTVTPSPVNPLGVKGAGETGAIASPACVANAVMDALSPFGVTHIDMPLTPAKLWRAMQA